MSDNNDNTLVRIASYDSVPSAYIDKGFLESNGIPAQVMASALSQIFPTPTQPVGQICLYVPASQEEEALRLLDER